MQRIPSQPDLRLYAEPSEVSTRIGGSVDPGHPHTINHLITGFLGDEEITLACFDDGDVVAYYNREIADWIASNSTGPLTPPGAHKQERPQFFFRQNVGRSAWGLAIHSLTRLIAVSSNRAEVTVFAPALASRADFDAEDELEESVRKRTNNWRIVVVLAPKADNIPNISFLDRSDGQAEKICAVDINGTLWIADIWRPRQPARKIVASTHPLLRSEEFWPHESRGWGVLPLLDHDFKIVETTEELYGVKPSVAVTPPSSRCNQSMLNIHEGMRTIPHNPCPLREMPLTILPPTNGAEPFNSANVLQVLSNLLAHQDSEADESAGEGVGAASEDEWAEGQPHSPAQVYGFQMDDEEGPFVTELDDADEGNPIPIIPAPEDDYESPIEDSTTEDEGDAGVSLLDHDMDDDVDDYMTTTEHAHGANLVSMLLNDPSSLAEFGIDPGDVAEEELFDEEADIDHGAFEAPYDPWLDEPGDLVGTDPVIPYYSSYSITFTSALDMPESAGLLNQQAGPWSWVPDVDLASVQDVFYIPDRLDIGAVPTETRELEMWLTRTSERNTVRPARDVRWERMVRRYRILRTFEKDLELRTLNDNYSALPDDELAVLCPDAVTFGHFQDPALRPFFRACSRLNMIAHIPELSLVVVASQVGRVLLLTPTKMAVGDSWQHGMRPEWILPRDDEELEPKKERRPLHGMSVAPVQQDSEASLGEEAAPRRFRLMLHYRNHEILTYEITRAEESDKLCIF